MATRDTLRVRRNLEFALGLPSHHQNEINFLPPQERREARERDRTRTTSQEESGRPYQWVYIDSKRGIVESELIPPDQHPTTSHNYRNLARVLDQHMTTPESLKQSRELERTIAEMKDNPAHMRKEQDFEKYKILAEARVIRGEGICRQLYC